MTVVDPWIASTGPVLQAAAVWFRGMRGRPEVAFVSPRRTLAATLELSSKTVPVILPAELIPSGQMLLYLSR